MARLVDRSMPKADLVVSRMVPTPMLFCRPQNRWVCENDCTGSSPSSLFKADCRSPDGHGTSSRPDAAATLPLPAIVECMLQSSAGMPLSLFDRYCMAAKGSLPAAACHIMHEVHLAA